MSNLGTRTMMTAIAVLMMLSITIIPTGEAVKPTFDDVAHDPDTIYAGDDVTVTVQLDDTDNITHIELLYCLDATCYPPIDMDDMGNDEYEATITRSFGAGDRIGYRVIIEYEEQEGNDTVEKTTYYPSEDDYIYYDIEGEEESDSDSTPFPGAPLVFVSVLVAMAVYRRRK